jgi:hypothetical protein
MGASIALEVGESSGERFYVVDFLPVARTQNHEPVLGPESLARTIGTKL